MRKEEIGKQKNREKNTKCPKGRMVKGWREGEEKAPEMSARGGSFQRGKLRRFNRGEGENLDWKS